jgi:hypothetical protein
MSASVCNYDVIITVVSSYNGIDVTYLYKYAEERDGNKSDPWVIRQIGIYHQHDRQKDRSIIIVLSHSPDSKFVKHLKRSLSVASKRDLLVKNPLLLHASLVSHHLPNWKGYLEYYEKILLETVSYCIILSWSI